MVTKKKTTMDRFLSDDKRKALFDAKYEEFLLSEETKEKTITNAVEILEKDFYEGRPDRQAELAEARAEEAKAREIMDSHKEHECFFCDSKDILYTTTESRETFEGVEITVNQPYWYCETCGKSWVTAADLIELDRIKEQLYREIIKERDEKEKG